MSDSRTGETWRRRYVERVLRDFDVHPAVVREVFGAITHLERKRSRLEDRIDHERSVHEQKERSFLLRIQENEDEKKVLEGDVQKLEGRLATLITESADSEADLKRKVADSKAQLEALSALARPLRGDVAAGNKTIEDLRRRETVRGQDVENRFSKVEQNYERYRTVANDQQKLIKRLLEKNTKLEEALGRHHVSCDH